MDDNNFFDKKENKVEENQDQTIKVGDKEYTTEELNSIVGLGETAKDYESKWNRSIKDFYPDYTQKSQELADFKRTQDEAKKQADILKQTEIENKPVNKLTPDEQRSMALKQARELGILTRDQLDEEVGRRLDEKLSMNKLLEDTNVAVEQAKEKWGIKTSTQSVLEHMSKPENPRNPTKAIKDMFESQIDKWKEDQLKGIRPTGMQTQEQSVAGSKQPEARNSTSKETLKQAILDSLGRQRGV
jgi:hypothetical protein